ncbi:signal recognition particle subunit SRP68 [Macrosteles quadrilineatus]|uniref:signal recognition particle subunit SRP68 n=1 Tax=Macrosteles quadrilineatus TaxID=74068 RepID=UPI0023E31771|nr:signal recognition particle subunit SRP68 [Macrosteles quadrilineatus]
MVEVMYDGEEQTKQTETPESGSTAFITLEILKVIKDAQQQHGLRHSDYQRYRGYCTRKIRRLRKVLKIPQGDKRHFKRRDVTEEKVKDERYLLIPLMLSERAWSHAMQLRQEANTEPRKRFHLVQRLRKATIYALQLQKLCESEKCDARTKLEAQAYVAWIHGSLHFELQMWKPAMENLNKAKMVYEKLISALSEEDQPVYKQRCDELAPSLRYCAYNIGDAAAMDDLLSLRSHAHGDLLDNLDTLMAQTKERKSEALSETTWRGRTFPVKPERVRLFLLADRALDASLTGTSSATERIEQLERHLMDCKDALAAAKEEVKNDPASKSRSGGPVTPMQLLVSYLTHIRVHRTIQRTNLMVEAAKAALADKSETEGRKTKPQDLTRLYEIILQHLLELQQLPGLEEDQEYQREVEAKTLAYKAFRCFYIAEVLAGLRRWREAGAMYQRAESYASKAQSQVPEMKVALTQLIEEVDGARYSSLAHAVLEDDSSDTPSQAVTSKAKKKIPLIDRLDEYREDPALATKQPNVVKLPPDMQPVPCKPLFFDLALNLIKYPNLEDKVDNAGKKGNPAGLTGFVKGLWGWGNK